MKDKPLHALKFLFTYPAKLRKKGLHLDLNAQKRKNYKHHKNSSRNGRILQPTWLACVDALDQMGRYYTNKSVDDVPVAGYAGYVSYS